MYYLILVSIIWAFSFGLIKDQLSGIDPVLVAFLRLFISFIIFLPFLRIRNVAKNIIPKLILTGGIQYGVMYITYIYAFQYLAAFEVAVLTIFTPLYVALINDLYDRKFSGRHLLLAVFAVIGAGIVLVNRNFSTGNLMGIVLMQISNLSFAFGQIYYKKILAGKDKFPEQQLFGLLYAGGVIVTIIALPFSGGIDLTTISFSAWLAILYLGIIASGFCFFLWNMGGRTVNAGFLAASNNLKIPLAVAVSLIFFGESTDLFRLACGGIIIIITMYIDFRSNQ